MRIIRTTFVVTAIAVFGGCYRWVPTEQAAVPPGAEVRAMLTDAGVDEMRRYFGPWTESAPRSSPSERWVRRREPSWPP